MPIFILVRLKFPFVTTTARNFDIIQRPQQTIEGNTMPDITGFLSTFKKELLSGRCMLVIFVWFLILIFSPNELKDFISIKVDIPYSFQLFTFSFSVLLYSFSFWLIKKSKATLRARKIRIKNKQAEQETLKKELELDETIRSLSEKEKEVIQYLLHSGYSYIEFESSQIPRCVNDLVNKGLIMQITFPSTFKRECRFILTSSVEEFIRKQLKLYSK